MIDVWATIWWFVDFGWCFLVSLSSFFQSVAAMMHEFFSSFSSFQFLWLKCSCITGVIPVVVDVVFVSVVVPQLVFKREVKRKKRAKFLTFSGLYVVLVVMEKRRLHRGLEGAWIRNSCVLEWCSFISLWSCGEDRGSGIRCCAFVRMFGKRRWVKVGAGKECAKAKWKDVCKGANSLLFFLHPLSRPFVQLPTMLSLSLLLNTHHASKDGKWVAFEMVGGVHGWWEKRKEGRDDEAAGKTVHLIHHKCWIIWWTETCFPPFISLSYPDFHVWLNFLSPTSTKNPPIFLTFTFWSEGPTCHSSASMIFSSRDQGDRMHAMAECACKQISNFRTESLLVCWWMWFIFRWFMQWRAHDHLCDPTDCNSSTNNLASLRSDLNQWITGCCCLRVESHRNLSESCLSSGRRQVCHADFLLRNTLRYFISLTLILAIFIPDDKWGVESWWLLCRLLIDAWSCSCFNDATAQCWSTAEFCNLRPIISLTFISFPPPLPWSNFFAVLAS